VEYVKSTWYVAAFGDEVSAALFERRICDESILMFRGDDGSVTAMSNRCPHRFAPLSRGKLLAGGIVRCGYHGLAFDGSGTCVHNPHGSGAIPSAAKVRSYPVVERHGIVWIWMGAKEEADAGAIPDFSFISDPIYNTQKGLLHNRGHYELYIDNLMDLSHVAYVHSGSIGNGQMEGGRHQYLQDEKTISANMLYSNVVAPPFWDAQLGGKGEPADHWLDISWRAPAHILLDAGAAKHGQSRAEGVNLLTLHLLTPETATSTHYFWTASRSHAIENTEFDKAIHDTVALAFGGEDEPMIAAVQEMMGDRSFDELKPVLLTPDAAAVRVRRALKGLVRAELEATS